LSELKSLTFSLLAQKKKLQKEKAANHLAFGSPALLKITGRCETRFAQTVLALFRLFLRCSAA
jgi:hypothetical protein